MITYVMSKKSYSGEMVRNNKKVILTIPGAKIADSVLGCGSITGCDTDKALRFDIELAEVEGSLIPRGSHRLFNIDIHRGEMVAINSIYEMGADVIILANGSTPGMHYIIGIDDQKAMGCLNAFAYSEKVGQNLIVIGGGITDKI